MTREEWNAYAESTPLTPYQRGAILGHCDRVGLTDRAKRLAVLAELLGLDDLGTTADLTLGQAGRLVNLLQRTRDRAELPGVTASADADEHQDDDGDLDGQGDEQPSVAPAGTKPATLADLISGIAVMLWRLFGTATESAKPDIAPDQPEADNADD